MIHNLRFARVTCLSATVLLLLTAESRGAITVDHSSALAPFVNQDTFAALYLDVASLGLPEKDEARLTPQLLVFLQSLPSEVLAELFIADFAQTLAVRFREAGGQGIYLVAGLGDTYVGGGPIAIATVQPGRKAVDLANFIDATLQQMATNNSLDESVRSKFRDAKVDLANGMVLFGSKSIVARYKDLRPAPRNDLIEPLTKLSSDGAVAAAVFSPGPDFRRVVRELWPELPGSLAPLKGELSDRWLNLQLAIDTPPDVRPRLVMEASDAEAAEVFAKLWRNLPAATTEFGGNAKSQMQVKGFAQLVVNLLPVKVDGKRVTIGVPTVEKDATKLQSMIGQAIAMSLEPIQRRERVDRVRQILIGMLNYHDVHKHLPPAAIRDKDGVPLLSWRVAILPYLEQEKLYKEFHLNEPWDSPHNSALITKMPGVYMDMGSKSDELNRQGKTTCQVPIFANSIFFKNDGTLMKEISDGTANTIMMVEVEPGRAVAWTKPDDWQVDFAHPRQGLERNDRNQFIAGFADGHVAMLPTDIDEKKLKALLTRDGKEPIENP